MSLFFSFTKTENLIPSSNPAFCSSWVWWCAVRMRFILYAGSNFVFLSDYRPIDQLTSIVRSFTALQPTLYSIKKQHKLHGTMDWYVILIFYFCNTSSCMNETFTLFTKLFRVYIAPFTSDWYVIIYKWRWNF